LVTSATIIDADVVVPGVRSWQRSDAITRSSALRIHCIQPLKDPRWDNFLSWHPRASVFHSSAWLKALNQTYGYEPIAYTTSSAADDLKDAVVFCRVNSWLTGRRLVSLPFSDHCEPLIDSPHLDLIVASIIEREIRQQHCRYAEMRPLCGLELRAPLHRTTVRYAFHQLDLEPELATIFRNFHRDSIQRKIRRSEREGLIYREGVGQDLLEQFYGLFTQTRAKHRVPAQPKQWFVNLIECFADALKIRVAYKEDRAIAAMLTLRHKDTLVYKYGCSDPTFNNLGSMHLLYWRAIQDAKAMGLGYFDLGRTDADQKGLITFKNRWGAAQSDLMYARYSASKNATHFFDLSIRNTKTSIAKYVLSCMPTDLVSKLGHMLYRHVG